MYIINRQYTTYFVKYYIYKIEDIYSNLQNMLYLYKYIYMYIIK